MLIIVIAAAVVVAASLAAGLAARARIARRPTAGVTAARLGQDRRWGGFARALLAPDRRIAGLALWLMIVDTALALAAPWPLQLVVDYGLGGRPFPSWLRPLAGLPHLAVAGIAAAAGLILLGIGAVAGYQVAYLTGALAERMTLRLRLGLLRHLMRVSPARTARFPLGELSSRLGSDAGQIADAVSAVIETIVPEVALLTGMIVITALLDWRLTLIALALVPLYALTARLRNRPLRSAQQHSRALSGRLNALTTDQLGMLPAVHVFDQAEAEAGRHAEAAGAAADAAVRALDASARFRPVNDILPGIGLAAALVVGTIEVTSGRLSVGGLLVFVAYLASLTSPIRALAGLSAVIARGTASRDRVTELLDLPPLEPAAADEPAGQAPAPGTVPSAVPVAAPGRGRHAAAARGLPIRLDRVSYQHRPGEPVLDRVSLDLAAGELACLTGPSGAGKSTLLSLLTRLADPASGRILVGGQDIAALPLSRLRALVTLVPQEPWLWSGTIAENIGYGLTGAGRAEIAAAAERAGVAGFAAEFAAGLDTPVGEHGRQLSVGQRRRVAIARALLRDTPVLLLDEPTAGLDQATEDRLVRELLASTQGKTVLLVTHAEALTRFADRTLRLAAGQVTDRPPGPIDDLAADRRVLAGIAS